MIRIARKSLRHNLPATRAISAVVVSGAAGAGEAGCDWRSGLSLMAAKGITVRTLRVTDAPSLFALLTTKEVARFISPPPTSVEGFEKFIAWTHRQQAAGKYVCFGIVPRGYTQAVGLIQVRAHDATFGLAEWGFAIGSDFWGTGLFQAAAHAVLDFVFDELGVYRLEARAVTENGRGHGALRKLGASCEAVLRRSFRRNGTRMNQRLWSILRGDWRLMNAIWGQRVH